MSELEVSAPTGAPDLRAGPPPAVAEPIAATPPPPPPLGLPVEFAAALAKFPFAFIAARRLSLPLVGNIGGKPSWTLTDAEADTIAPLIKWYLDQALPAGSPAQQLALALGAAFAVRYVADKASGEPLGQRPPAAPPAMQSGEYAAGVSHAARTSPAPLPDWAQAVGQAPAAVPVAPGKELSPREPNPTRSDFYAGPAA